MQNELISRSALIEIGTARKIIEVVGNWNELSGIAKAACVRLGIAHRKLILEAPTVDAAEVVRCCECIHRDGTPGQPNILCYQMHDDDFCSYGERRADDG